MKFNRAYRHKLRFNPEQEEQARRFAGCARLTYNAGLRQRQLSYELYGRSPWYERQTYDLPEWKRDPEFLFLQEVPSHVLQQALKDLDQAFKRFYSGQNGYPRPRKRGENDGFRYPDAKQIKTHNPARDNQVRLPKLGWVSVRNCYPRLKGRLFEGELKSVTVRLTADGWYISFSTELKVDDPAPPTGLPVGLDVGITNSVTLSDGQFIQFPVIGKREQEKLAILQRDIARKTPGSRNRSKAKARLAKQSQRLQRRRLDAQHKFTTALAREHPLIVHEALKIKSMSKSARGTLEEPGKNVAQKAGLNRAIQGQAWGELYRQLAYKTIWKGGRCLPVPACHSSTECQVCHHVAKENRENQAVFHCLSCSFTCHADLNAAVIIRERGEAKLREEEAEERKVRIVKVRTGGTPVPGAEVGLNACEDGSALKNPERARPSRKAAAREGVVRNQVVTEIPVTA